MSLVKFKINIEYSNGNMETLRNVLYTDAVETMGKIKKSTNIKNATVQEYPLINNEIRDIIRNFKWVYQQKDREHIVSFSGGKDSTAMLIRMLELGMDIDKIVFADTKYEFEEMYEYIDKVEKYIQDNFDPNLKIIRVSTDDELEDWIFGKVTRGKMKGETRGFPLTLYSCYWSRESKVKQLDKIMQGQYRYIGIAIDEKRRVSKYKDDSLFVYPLIDWGWTEEDCMNYLESIDLVNPLYGKDINRTGCWFCPKQGINSWRRLYHQHKEKWEQLKDWEYKLKKPIHPSYSIDDLETRFENELLDE